MISHDMKQGSVGVSRSFTNGLVLLQVTDEDAQARAVLTKGQAEKLILRIKNAIKQTTKKVVRGMRKCPKCGKFFDPDRWRSDDKLGQGEFCNSRWLDKTTKKWYCSTKAAEGYDMICPYTKENVTKRCHELCCGNERFECSDFEPSKKLRKEFGIKE